MSLSSGLREICFRETTKVVLVLLQLNERFSRSFSPFTFLLQRPIEFGELSIGEQALEAIIANYLPHNLPVFLFYIALIEARVEDALW